MPGQLNIVSTPIGNLRDITFRAIEVLKSVDLILAEDTRVAQKLLNHYSIENKITSFNFPSITNFPGCPSLGKNGIVKTR